MLGVLMTLAEGTLGADTSTSYPPRGAAAAALRVLRLVAASAPEHARRIGAEGVSAAAVRAAVSTGTPETSREAAGVWIETLRLWSATAAAGGATPSVDGLYPLIAPMLELPTATRGPEHASTAAAVAAEAFALLAAVVDAGGLSRPKSRLPENAETAATTETDDAPESAAHPSHPSAALSMTETSSATMSWACAAGAAKAAEAWATATNPGARSAPAAYLRGVAVPERRAVLGARAAEELPSASLDAKMRKWMALRSRGVRVNDALRESKGFRNPDFLQSAVSRFGIDERATMFSPDVFDPNEIAGRKEDDYQNLAAAQKRAAERREKERKAAGPNRVVQFRSAAAERAAAAAAAAAAEVTRRKRGRGA